MKNKLLEFYFGGLSESERLQMEQQLLIDSETLVNYLDLKRAIESAEIIPSHPSNQVWQNLRARLTVKKKVFFPFVLGAAAAIVVLILWTINLRQISGPDKKPGFSGAGLIFDSSRELPAGSNVL
jgi:hypothetical protein